MCRHTGAYFSLKTDDWYDSRWTRSQSWKHSSRHIHWEIKPTSSRQQRKFSCQVQKQSTCLMRSQSLIPTPTQQEMSGWTDRWTDSQTHEWPGLARRRAWLLGSSSWERHWAPFPPLVCSPVKWRAGLGSWVLTSALPPGGDLGKTQISLKYILVTRTTKNFFATASDSQNLSTTRQMNKLMSTQREVHRRGRRPGHSRHGHSTEDREKGRVSRWFPPLTSLPWNTA